jgi:predicted transcriptional regulator
VSKTKKGIIKFVGRKGKTKGEIADGLNLSYSYAADTVNKLLYAGELEVKSTEGRKTIFCTPAKTSAPATVSDGKLVLVGI